jgi:hypothetical protein
VHNAALNDNPPPADVGFFWSQIMRRKDALIAGVIAGIASPGAIGAPSNYRLPQGSDLQRMRGDAVRVGGDFSTVMKREHGKQTTASSAKD